ncbi:glycosyltransferase involved in cell wall biosynthesis [Salinibacter ruber]|jgi:glycosyltransferase involved in cell wall biosynthesis|uniref:glycosyltransferase family 4 protein n=1 Tax=Salinibacter ruber TaxID=146919 RepID=UPI002168200C|nr:glycosyltransferase family 4 protein [Salinibacter ruber]MCS3650592.1 glycosyltransferase involved in cell wall biosynthesis [Salinibacter ruber]MCS3653844.1 glycosyltransferase involved in cell wall biosynthesis [Salinibacter ruber]
MSKVWILSEVYYPEERSTGYLLTQIAERLATRHDVGVITGPATMEREVVDAPRQDARNGVDIYRGLGTDFPEKSLVGQVVNWVTRTVPIAKRALRRIEAQDTIIVVTNPPLLPYLALAVKWATGCNVILLVHDMYPEVLSATGTFSEDSLIVKGWNQISRVLYRQVNRIITLGRDMTHRIAEKLGGDESKIFEIPNWAENDIIKPQPRSENRILEKEGLRDKFVVLYAGNHGRTHAIESLLDVARKVENRQNEDIHFFFAGYGAKKDWLEDYAMSHGLANVTSYGGYPRSEQKKYLNAGDLAVISFIPGMAGISVPSRMYNHMAAGKPILAVADHWSELAQVVEEESVGWWVPPGNPEAVQEAITYASRHPEECQQKGERAAEVARTTYSFKNVMGKYETVIEEVL